MSQKIHDWIAAQIEAASPDKVDATYVPRLADAAAALLGKKEGQIFGLGVSPATIPDAAALAQRCLAMLDQWGPRLSPEQRKSLAKLLGNYQLGPAVPPPTPACVLRVYTRVTLMNIDTEDILSDPAVASRLDGAEESDPIDLVHLPCVEAVTGGREGWAISGSAKLVWHLEAQELRCELRFDLAREPSAPEIDALLRMVSDELFSTGWGESLGWDRADVLPDDVIPHVDSKPVVHRLSGYP